MTDPGLLVLARCAGFAFRAPGFSHPSVPPPLRAVFAYAFASLLSPFAASRAARVPPAAFAGAVVAELLLGAALGTAASLLYDGAYAGGRALDDYVGVRGSLPAANVAVGAGFGRLWSLAFAAGFFVLGGDRLALGAFADSFRAIPSGALVTAPALALFAYALPATLVRAALFVGGPALACALVAQVALAALARVVPRFASFSLSFGIVFALALGATLIGFPAIFSGSGVPWLTPATALYAR